MSAADRIVQEYRVRKRRFVAAVSAVELLSTEQRKELIVLLVDRVESETRAPRVGLNDAVLPEPVRRRNTERRGTKTERAEALVHERPGMTASQIAELIGQNRPAADSTLRSIKLRRATIERRDGRWYPVSPTNSGGSDSTAN